MARLDPHVAAHLEWIGFVRPTGLVVSAPALVRAGVILNRHDTEGQRLLRAWDEDTDARTPTDRASGLAEFRGFAETVLRWSFSPKGYGGTPDSPVPPDLEIGLPESGGVFRPDFAVRTEPLRVPPNERGERTSTWQLLVSVIDPAEGFDHSTAGGLELSAHGRMERLLRHTGVPAGLIFNGTALRLVSAPTGENSGWLDFHLADMLQAAGRPICSAMRELLGQTRLLSVPADKRLAALLHDSRKFQNEVSERLAQQVLHALYELLRGFQAAHDTSGGELLGRQLIDDSDKIYQGLLTVVLRLVFLLYAEERDMLPQDEIFLGSYAVSGLYERLREDAAIYPDTMDQRYGAYAQLLALWRMVHDGARGPQMSLSPRHGDLFHPDRYPFLEGRGGEHVRQVGERVDPPLVSDGAIHRVLEKLIVLDAERISYRALDVEHIGSVYETMMGFRLETATGRSIAVKAAKKHGAPATVNIEELLAERPPKRAKWLRDRTDRKLTAKVSRAVQQVDPQVGGTIDDLHAALDSVIDKNATPDLVPTGAMVLQPSEERRRSGSHYTPRELTEPIVRIALEPIFNRLREKAQGPPQPEQILDLKVCDPAMGSGAFLVESCRQLADALIESWRVNNIVPVIPPDENEVIFARRLVAQRCLYGVDRNPKAVDLAKLSLWLTTLAKEHPLTFLDHALRHGDSLVGLSIPQIQAFHWKGDAPIFEEGFEALQAREHLARAAELRQLIREADDTVADWELRDLWDEAQTETREVRRLGDLVLLAFFKGTRPKERELRRRQLAESVLLGDTELPQARLAELRNAEQPLVPFHWEIEFPEVFDRDNPGFDSIVGNPPFLGGRNLSAAQGEVYSKWLLATHEQSNGGADLVAHFFRRAFDLIRSSGTFGLIATNTIAQGDTRTSGLRWICQNDGEVYCAQRRVKWPGVAAVIISIVHVSKGSVIAAKCLDNTFVEKITAFLFYRGGHQDPKRLANNSAKSFQGSIVLGMGFTFDDRDRRGVASSLEEMNHLIDENPNNREVLYPYIGGEELNGSPTHDHHRHIINFGENDQAHCMNRWPQPFHIAERRVKPERMLKDADKYPRMVNEWWKYWNARPELYAATSDLRRVLANSRVSHRLQYAFLPSNMVYADSLIVYPFETYAAFCMLQSRLHEAWALFFGSSMKDDLRYTPSDCFETFPFPRDWKTQSDLEMSGKEYYNFRADLMVRNDEGMTKTYNRFHDPYENNVDIERLRTLHTAMDRAVLAAYGWSDVPVDCEFLLDYEIEEETWGNKKKPYRYRWPNEVRDAVLARLLELNGELAVEEAQAGITKRTRTIGGRRSDARSVQLSAEEGYVSATLWDTAF
ncbi:MAG: N-6 DNA methylase [Acidimicrobiaceae bacterium]|nr:SAM-dependent methyltransferase [Acidimicrobiia bacterium]MCY4493709.1 N-6 DNA methylase [Acidimicrobiaceae bacterium]